MFSFLMGLSVDGFSLWVVLLICCGVFLASFMDAIAGGGGIVSVPTYILGFSGLPIYYALATNKLSASLGAIFSAARFIRQGYVNWVLFTPAAVLALLGAAGGAWLQLRTPDTVLKYLLLIILPAVAALSLRNHGWPDESGEMTPRARMLVVWTASAIIGAYDGYYGPGTGTFLMMAFIRLGKLGTRYAAGGAKLINLASGIGSLITGLATGHVMLGIGLTAAVASVAGAYVGAGLAIKNGSRIVRPTVVLVLFLLTIKVGSELLFPEFWA